MTKMSENKEQNLKKRPSAAMSLMPLLVLVALLTFVIRAFGSDSLAGASQIALLAASAFCVLIGMWRLNVPWSSFEKAIVKNVSSVASAIIILLLIGALGGAWMLSGVVPTLIYYGMHIIHPDIFLVSSCIICALVSVMTGSSWTTIATIGIALMGIGRAQGFADGWIAGAIISGAYFGDKISPLSDTTTLASGSLGVALFDHIRYMVYTTVPSIVIALMVFAVAGLLCDTNTAQDIGTFALALKSPLLHIAVAAACTRAHGRVDSQACAAHHHVVPLVAHGCCGCLGVSGRCAARDRPFDVQGGYALPVRQHSACHRRCHP